MALRRTLNAAMQMAIMYEDDMALADMGDFLRIENRENVACSDWIWNHCLT